MKVNLSPQIHFYNNWSKKKILRPASSHQLSSHIPADADIRFFGTHSQKKGLNAAAEKLDQANIPPTSTFPSVYTGMCLLNWFFLLLDYFYLKWGKCSAWACHGLLCGGPDTWPLYNWRLFNSLFADLCNTFFFFLHFFPACWPSNENMMLDKSEVALHPCRWKGIWLGSSQWAFRWVQACV